MSIGFGSLACRALRPHSTLTNNESPPNRAAWQDMYGSHPLKEHIYDNWTAHRRLYNEAAWMSLLSQNFWTWKGHATLRFHYCLSCANLTVFLNVCLKYIDRCLPGEDGTYCFIEALATRYSFPMHCPVFLPKPISSNFWTQKKHSSALLCEILCNCRCGGSCSQTKYRLFCAACSSQSVMALSLLPRVFT